MELFENALQTGRIFKAPAFCFRVDRKHVEKRALRKKKTCDFMTEVSRRPKLISYYCVFKFFQRSLDGNHMMRFQSETFIFKFLWRSVAGFCVVKIFVLVDFIETLFHLTPFSPEFFLFLCPGL